MQYLIGLIGGWLASKISRKIIIVTLNGLVIAVYISVFSYFLIVLVKFYNYIIEVINFSDKLGRSADSIVQKFLGLLNCIGFIDAIYISLPFIFPAITSLLFAIFHKIVLMFYTRFRVLIVDIVR